MRVPILIIFIFLSSISFGQTNEDLRAKQFFQSEYLEKNYEKYHGEVTQSGSFFTFGNNTLKLGSVNNSLSTIFSIGILYPSIIYFGPSNFKRRMDGTVDTISIEQNVLLNPKSNDTLKIFELEEIKFIEVPDTKKRFRFWLYTKGMLNPTVCFFELTNKQATDKTDILNFIKGSTLTFFKEGWIII